MLDGMKLFAHRYRYGHYGDVQLSTGGGEDPARTNSGISARIGKTTDAAQLLGVAGDGGQSVVAQLQRKLVLLAKSLELQFWDLNHFPHTSKHVRLAAHSARTIHGDTVALFQRFSVTAKHIVNTLMPMLLDGIELKEPSLVAGAFGLVLSSVQDMMSGSSSIQSSYEELVSKIQHVNEQIQKAEVKRREEVQKQIADILKAEKEVEYKTENLQSELTTLCGKLAQTSQNISEMSRNESILREEIEKRKKEVMHKFQRLQGREVIFEERNHQVFMMLADLHGIAKKLNELEMSRSQLASKKEEQGELHKQVQTRNSTKNDLLEKLQVYGEEKTRKMAETPINPEGGGNAWYVLQELLPYLGEICEFWNTMVQNIQPLATEEEAARVYQSTTSSERVRQIFMEKMSLSQQGWKRFDNLSSNFVIHFRQDPKDRMETLYGFLSAPIGQSHHEIDARTTVLRKEI